MKKFLWIVAAVAALVAMPSCEQGKNYKAMAEDFSRQLDQMCEQQDSAGVFAVDKAIRDMEAEIVAAGDSAGIADFRAALKDARERAAVYMTTIKVKNGADANDAVGDVINDALEGDVGIEAVTKAIDASLEVQKKK